MKQIHRYIPTNYLTRVQRKWINCTPPVLNILPCNQKSYLIDYREISNHIVHRETEIQFYRSVIYDECNIYFLQTNGLIDVDQWKQVSTQCIAIVLIIILQFKVQEKGRIESSWDITQRLLKIRMFEYQLQYKIKLYSPITQSRTIIPTILASTLSPEIITLEQTRKWWIAF